MSNYSLRTDKTWYETKSDLEEMFRKWRVRDFQIVGRPLEKWVQTAEERTVTVRFLHPSGREVVVTLARQGRAVDNLRAIYLGLEDMRMMEARGISDVVRDAYLQLAAPERGRDPYEVLGVRSDSPAEVVEAAYRALVKKAHPDTGGDAAAFKAIQDAYERIGR